MRLAILGSTRGTSMLPLIAAIQQKKLHATIEAVISNKKEALILERAREHKIPTYFLNHTDNMSVILKNHAVDLILLIGYMRILPKPFVNEWHQKIMNVHPSLLPDFSGGMNDHVHQAVLNAKVSYTGCTVHYVTETVDAGPIVIQKKCKVLPTDTVESLKARVQQLEGEALIEAINYVTHR